jgi:TonB family protein
MWYAAHRLRIERERACDDVVLNLGAAATDYADHLVQIVRGLRGARSLSFAGICMAQPSQLESRLVSILAPHARRRGLARGGLVTLSMLTLILTMLIGAINVSAQRTRIAGGESNAAVIPPRIIKSSPASYPEYGLTLRVEGTVTLEAKVDVHGNLTNVRVVKGLGFGLDEQAIAAVQTWQFAPALKNGVPVEAITQIDVDFKLPASVGPPKTKGTSETVRMGPGVIPPTVISRVQPDYTEEARAAKYEGTVVVKATVGVDGTLKVEKVLRELDHGLTENAVEALKQWKFKPGLKNGKPVAVSLNIEVNFRLQ